MGKEDLLKTFEEALEELAKGDKDFSKEDFYKLYKEHIESHYKEVERLNTVIKEEKERRLYLEKQLFEVYKKYKKEFPNER